MLANQVGSGHSMFPISYSQAPNNTKEDQPMECLGNWIPVRLVTSILERYPIVLANEVRYGLSIFPQSVYLHASYHQVSKWSLFAATNTHIKDNDIFMLSTNKLPNVHVLAANLVHIRYMDTLASGHPSIFLTTSYVA